MQISIVVVPFKAMALPVRPRTAGNGAANGESIKVVVRCRPLSETEIKQGHQNIVSMHPNRGVVEMRNPKDSSEPPKCFTFDSVYDGSSKQIDLYDETFRDLVNSVLNGFNGTIFAYGQTGTGKTFTMEGVADVPELRGVIPNSFEHIFQHIAQSQNQQYLVRASYLEIYQEEIRDLLNKDSKARLELKERPDVGVYVKDLSTFATKSVAEIKHVMSVGNSNRSVGRTNMNEHSSRSHAIFIITIECSEPGPDGENHIRVGRLNLVDLAGSERQTKTGAVGERLKEATKINLSLSALGNVISALVDGKSSHVPYRDSKLTRLLQDSLGGNSKTVMVANIGPASYNFDETLGTLRYANRAKNIKNKPKINEDPKDALLREFQDEIARLRAVLEKRANSAGKRKKTKRTTVANGEENDLGDVEKEMEEHLRKQQKQLDEDRRAVLADTNLFDDEKRKILTEMEENALKLAKEREAQTAVAAKIRTMQSKLLSGDGNLLDQTKEQQRQLEKKRIELADQKRREREILQELEAHEDNTAEIHQTFTNLRQEVDAKTKKLKKMVAKIQQIKGDIQDSGISHSEERQDLENSLTEINKELKLKLLIVENFIPPDTRERLKERAYFDEDELDWVILQPGQQRPKSSSSFESNHLTTTEEDSSFRRMVDSGLGTGGSDVSMSTNSGNFAPVVNSTKRPVSVMGMRRPISDYEKGSLTRLRHRMGRKVRSPAATCPANDDPFIPEEIMRFSGENVISFSHLEQLPQQTSSYQKTLTLYSKNKKEETDNVVIDAAHLPSTRRDSRIPLSKSVSSSRINSASHSKNAVARNALTRMGTAGTGDASSMFPRARGLVPAGVHGKR
ncbi:hypothetical protein QR680_003374 [Steinernema hermaphroditum]|uniref:Kinesin-like protein n=1 Tax=Steinernema hermaphroditum TaxID=289476 RepID=A0AA39H7E3_9BILA|nr:hypothetical protein QR680_003374 [Steinernema hermaphroditum]